ncbi:MAG: hypothetical protein PVJ68_12785 [Candidatus Thiodiazotropha sp.]
MPWTNSRFYRTNASDQQEFKELLK